MEIMDHPITQEMKFKDLWEVRKWVRLVNVEEGLVQSWHWDRVVLVGDSVHKMTPNSGLGVNQGWQGVVALTNPDPDSESLTKAFKAYHARTEKMARDSFRLSKLYTRITSWHNIAYRLADYVGPYVGGDLLLFRMLASPIVKQGIILDFLPERGHKTGRIKWDNKPQKKADGDIAAI
jgi:2-polyprenyl-6-methoxyphenol hydroxylase-like FAD-dependent oxidoreductase